MFSDVDARGTPLQPTGAARSQWDDVVGVHEPVGGRQSAPEDVALRGNSEVSWPVSEEKRKKKF